MAESERLDYSIIALSLGPWKPEDYLETVKLIRGMIGDDRMIAIFADATMSIPNGDSMVDLSVRLAEDPDGIKTDLDKTVDIVLESAKPLAAAGADAVLMCADYCFNDGPFLSPKMFSEFVTPYLTRQVAGFHELGIKTVKHTDGNIMPILDQLVASGTDAIHSIDPQGGMDLAEVKRLVGDKVALCGNVHCGMLQMGTIDQIVEDSKRSLRDGMPGGGYFFCSSNTPFIGMPLQNYLAMLDVRKEFGRYDK